VAANDTVFVIHGRNQIARDALFAFLRSLQLRPLEWSQAITLTGKPSPMISEILDAAFSSARAVVVLLTGDDQVRLSPELVLPSDPVAERDLMPQARPNVLFEAGLAWGRSSEQTIFVEIGPVKGFSDNAGRHVVRLTDRPASRKDLVNRLKLAGCEPDDSGSDWLTVGDFTLVVSGTKPSAAVPVPAKIPAVGGWLATRVEVERPDITSVSNFTCKLLKQDTPFWRFGWRLEITNRSRGDAKYKIECRFLDENGHQLDHEIERSAFAVKPFETKEFSGSARVDAVLDRSGSGAGEPRIANTQLLPDRSRCCALGAAGS